MDTEERLADLKTQIAAINASLEEVPQLVRRARMAGASWTQIGNALGMSKQAAHQQYAAGIGYDFPLYAD